MDPGWERRDHRPIPDRFLHPPDPPLRPRSRPTSPSRGASGAHGFGPRWARERRPKDRGPIRRRHEDRMLGGVAGALAARTGLDVTVVRIGLVLAALASGVGVAAYVVAWLVIPVEGDATGIGPRALGDARGLALAVALIPALVITLLLASALRAGWLGSLAWPLFISAAGLVLVWRDGSEEDRTLLRRAATPLAQIGAGMGRTWTGLAWRLAIGAALAVGGGTILTVGHRNAVFRPLGGVGLVLAAFVIVFGPWWLSVARQLVLEREGRRRAEERADLAARVHDSVLQTLALIQRNADQPQRVAQLARAQERELRSWLLEGRPPGSFDDGLATVAAVVGRIQDEVEAAHGVRVEVVVVGDGPLTDDIEALLAAGREATVNAAKWSGAEVVSLFAEVEVGKVSLFVRDRGRGFDPLAIAPDRRGIAQSIKGRMARVGGQATIRTAPGDGTEVELTLPRRARPPGAHRDPVPAPERGGAPGSDGAGRVAGRRAR